MSEDKKIEAVTKGKIMASAAIDVSKIPPSLPAEKTKAETNTYDYIPFGSDNLFPNQLAAICRRSPIHRGIIKSKLNYIIGDGLLFDKENKALSLNVGKINSRESLIQLLKKIVLDYLYIGNSYIEIVTKEDSNFISMFHQDGSKCRLHKSAEYVIVHPDFNYYQSKKKLAKIIPVYPYFTEPDKDGYKRSIFHLKEYEMEYEYYGMPEYLSALEAIGISYKTNKWNLSRLENSFQFSGLLEIIGGFTSEDEAKRVIDDAKAAYTGEGNNSKIFAIAKNSGADSSKFVPFPQQSEGEWIQLHEQANGDIIRAHSWFSALAGIEQAGKLGDNQQMRIAYDIIHSSYVPNRRALFLDMIKTILKNEAKVNASSLEFINKPAPSLSDKINIDNTLTQNERREMLGYEMLEEQVKQGLNGAQVTSMVEVMRAYNTNEIDRGSAEQILKVAFGLPDDEVQKFFKIL